MPGSPVTNAARRPKFATSLKARASASRAPVAPSEDRRTVRTQAQRQRRSHGRRRCFDGCGAVASGRRAKVVRLLQNLDLERLQRGSGFEAQLASQRRADALIHVERVSLAATAIQRQHQLCREMLTRWCLHQEALELGDQLGVPSQLELGVDAALERAQSQLLQAPDFALGEVLERDLGQPQHTGEREGLVKKACALKRNTASTDAGCPRTSRLSEHCHRGSRSGSGTVVSRAGALPTRGLAPSMGPSRVASEGPIFTDARRGLGSNRAAVTGEKFIIHPQAFDALPLRSDYDAGPVALAIFVFAVEFHVGLAVFRPAQNAFSGRQAVLAFSRPGHGFVRLGFGIPDFARLICRSDPVWYGAITRLGAATVAMNRIPAVMATPVCFISSSCQRVFVFACIRRQLRSKAGVKET